MPRPHTLLVGVQDCIWTTSFWNLSGTRGCFGTLPLQCNLLAHRQKLCWKPALGYSVPPQSGASKGCYYPGAGGFHTPQHGGAKLWAPKLHTAARLTGVCVGLVWGFLQPPVLPISWGKEMYLKWVYSMSSFVLTEESLSSCNQNNVSPPVHQGVTTE